MTHPEKTDIRVLRTREAIRRAFEEMICEMDFEQISIKELAQRARINRKTFYLHYNGLEDLLRELQDEMTQTFVQRTREFLHPRDMEQITRAFFQATQELGLLGERITCSGSYQYISRRITDNIMASTWGNEGKDPYTQNILMAYVSEGTLAIYKQWVADGKKLSLEDITDLAVNLVCRGINAATE